MTTINTYEVGDRIKLETTTPFQDESEVDFNPEVVSFRVKPPGGAVVSYVYGTDANVTRPSTGTYECQIDVDKAGDWYYRIVGEYNDGTNAGASQGYFKVRPPKA